MNRLLKVMVLGLVIINSNLGYLNASNFTYETATEHEQAMHMMDRARTICADALNLHGISTIDYHNEVFNEVILRKDHNTENPELNKALQDVLKGYVFLHNVETLYVEIYSFLSLKNKDISEDDRIGDLLYDAVLSADKSIVDEYNANFNERLYSVRKIFNEKTYIKDYTLISNLYEGLWFLMTNQRDFHGLSYEARRKLNLKNLNKIDLQIALLDPIDEQAKIERLKALREKTDISAKLQQAVELRTIFGELQEKQYKALEKLSKK